MLVRLVQPEQESTGRYRLESDEGRTQAGSTFFAYLESGHQLRQYESIERLPYTLPQARRVCLTM